MILSVWLQAMCPHVQVFTYYFTMHVTILYNCVQYFVDQQLDYSVAIYSYLTIVSTSPHIKFTISQMWASISLLDTYSPFSPCFRGYIFLDEFQLLHFACLLSSYKNRISQRVITTGLCRLVRPKRLAYHYS